MIVVAHHCYRPGEALSALGASGVVELDNRADLIKYAADIAITPHSVGNPQHYEANVAGIFAENIERLRRGQTPLLNQIV